MHFIPSFRTISKGEEPGIWLLFRGNELLLQTIEKDMVAPYIEAWGALGVGVVRTQYLGKMNGKPCYSGECTTATSPPEGMGFYPLRHLFNHGEESLFFLGGRAFQIMNWDRMSQYCGQCGLKTEPSPSERAKVCPKCDQLNFPRLSPAIIVAVIRGDKILLAHSKRHPRGMYSVLAGFVEPGETLEECVRREVKEETGVKVTNIQYFGSQPWPFPDSLMIAFTAEYVSGDLRMDDDEILDADWYKADKMPPIPGKISIARNLIDWFVEKRL